MTGPGITIRRGRPGDSRAAFDVSIAAMRDLFVRQGIEWTLDPEEFHTQLEPFLAHLAVTAAEWWVAEDPADDSMIGYARSIERDGLFQLSEFFVRPERQSGGLGRRLIELAFPPGRGEARIIIATTDVRAIASYYRAGTVARFPIASLGASPQAADAGDLEAVRATADDIAEVAAIETAVVGYPRHVDYAWLFDHREAYLYRRDGRAVGFAFSGEDGQGPVAALDPADQASILLHVEGRTHERGMANISFEVPMLNEIAMGHLLSRGFRIEPPLTLFMSSVPFGNFDRFLPFGPPIVL